MRINNVLVGMPEKLKAQETRLATLEDELQNARAEAERPFPKEDELREKSARLAQLNRELEKPKHRAAEHIQDGNNTQRFEDDVAPGMGASNAPMPQNDKPSIRQALRDYTPPAPVHPGTEKDQRRGTEL